MDPVTAVANLLTQLTGTFGGLAQGRQQRRNASIPQRGNYAMQTDWTPIVLIAGIVIVAIVIIKSK